MRLALGLLATSCTLVLFHCSSLPDPCRGAECGVAPDGSSSEGGADGGGDVVVPEGCDPPAEPKDSPKCVDDGFGVFADATGGSDSNAGTKTSPVKSVGSALGKLGNRSRVYVCAGTYEESVKVTGAVAIYGGFACGSWTYGGGETKVSPKDAGYALEVSGAQGFVASDVTFTSAAGSSSRRSSVAMFVHGASGKLVRVVGVAGAGQAGAGATVTANYDRLLLASNVLLRGNGGTGATGGLEQTCATLCKNNEQSTGGKGGKGGNAPGNGDPGKPDRGAGLAGIAGGVCAGVGTGGTGNVGAPGGEGVPSAKLGELTASGWTPSDGAPGKAGGPGQGGGGGGGAGGDSMEGAGGGGGCGGCGASGGSVAEGGGASIALLSLDSTLVVTGGALTSGKAGVGGAGVAGEVGQIGGNGGIQASGGCQGGKGGEGGPGGASAGGAGGVSAAVASKGPKPALTSVILTAGTKGGPGAGGSASNAGLDGQSSPALEVQ